MNFGHVGLLGGCPVLLRRTFDAHAHRQPNNVTLELSDGSSSGPRSFHIPASSSEPSNISSVQRNFRQERNTNSGRYMGACMSTSSNQPDHRSFQIAPKPSADRCVFDQVKVTAEIRCSKAPSVDSHLAQLSRNGELHESNYGFRCADDGSDFAKQNLRSFSRSGSSTRVSSEAIPAAERCTPDRDIFCCEPVADEGRRGNVEQSAQLGTTKKAHVVSADHLALLLTIFTNISETNIGHPAKHQILVTEACNASAHSSSFGEKRTSLKQSADVGNVQRMTTDFAGQNDPNDTTPPQAKVSYNSGILQHPSCSTVLPDESSDFHTTDIPNGDTERLYHSAPVRSGSFHIYDGFTEQHLPSLPTSATSNGITEKHHPGFNTPAASNGINEKHLPWFTTPASCINITEKHLPSLTTSATSNGITEKHLHSFSTAAAPSNIETHLPNFTASAVSDATAAPHQAEQSTTILPHELAAYSAVLILDCRSFVAFNANHISGALNVGCADRITRKRLLCGRMTVGHLVSGEDAKALYQRLEQQQGEGLLVIIYDDNTSDIETLPVEHPLKLLVSCLLKQGKSTAYLKGGLHEFYRLHRSLCSEPLEPPSRPMLYSPSTPVVDSLVDVAEVSQILPFLFVGNERDSACKDRLIQLGITHILNVTSQLPQHFEADFNYTRLPATDSGCQNLRQYFEEAINFIDVAASSGGRVLVHCQGGVSRSPTITIAYVMARTNLDMINAFNFVKNRRAIIAPNFNFMGQLLEFEQRLRTDDLRRAIYAHLT